MTATDELRRMLDERAEHNLIVRCRDRKHCRERNMRAYGGWWERRYRKRKDVAK